MSPTHQDLSNDTTFNQIKSRVPVPLSNELHAVMCKQTKKGTAQKITVGIHLK